MLRPNGRGVYIAELGGATEFFGSVELVLFGATESTRH